MDRNVQANFPVHKPSLYISFIFLQVDLRPEPIETYPGPSQPVDFVLMSHVCYYFRDSFPVQIKRALQWLRPGGRLVLVHKQVDQFKREFREFFFIHFRIYFDTEQLQILQNDKKKTTMKWNRFIHFIFFFFCFRKRDEKRKSTLHHCR